MEPLKSSLVSVAHPKLEAHTFTSLGRATGYSRAGIHCLYSRGEIKVILAQINHWDNIIVLTKEEIERIRNIRAAKKSIALVRKAKRELAASNRKLRRAARKRERLEVSGNVSH